MKQVQNDSKFFNYLEMEKKNQERESNIIQSLVRMGRVRVNEEKKSLRVSRDAVIGIKTWGRIDYLVNHRGWSMVMD